MIKMLLRTTKPFKNDCENPNYNQRRKNRKVNFTINEKPKGKARPRFVRTGRFVRTYNPKLNVDYETEIKNAFLESVGDNLIDTELQAEVFMRITAYFKPPKSFSKKRTKETIEKGLGYMHKPDCDNIAKMVADALNGIAYKDDNQITFLSVEKKYGEEDKIDVEVEYL